MTCATAGPPIAFTAATLSTPYSTAWRTSSLLAAPLASGLRRLNTMYGYVVDQGQTWKLESPEDSSPGIDDGLTGVSIGRCSGASFISSHLVSVGGAPFR